MSVFFFIIIIVGLVTFGEVMSKFFEQGARRPVIEPETDAAELGRLREHVALLSEQVDRLTEEQRFMTRLLESAPRPASHSVQNDPGVAGAAPQTEEPD